MNEKNEQKKRKETKKKWAKHFCGTNDTKRRIYYVDEESHPVVGSTTLEC